MKRWIVCLLLASLAGAWAQDKKDAKNEKQDAGPPIRVCVAQLRNTSRRSVTLVLPQDRLVRDLRGLKPPKKAADRRRIEGIGLRGNSPEDAGSEASDSRCDFTVYATVTELRDKGDPLWRDERAQGIGTLPPQGGQNEPETFAVIEFSVRRPGSPTPILQSWVSGHEVANEEATVERLMDQIASQVNVAVRETPPEMRE